MTTQMYHFLSLLCLYLHVNYCMSVYLFCAELPHVRYNFKVSRHIIFRLSCKITKKETISFVMPAFRCARMKHLG